MRKLTIARVRSIQAPGLYGDGGTLFLRVAPGGSKQWVQRLRVRGGPRRAIGLGSVELVTLAQARELAFENRKLARRGVDPLAERRKAAVPLFRDAARATYDTLRKRWTNDKTAANWWAHLERHALPKLGDKPVNAIQRQDVLAVLTPIWTAKPETARRVRRNVRQSLQWAVAQGYVDMNVAGEAIDGALPAMPAVKAHRRALPYAECPAALETIGASTRSSWAAIGALTLVILTACRSGEVRGARWDEIDLDARLWRIPAGRMKGRREHVVPLADAAVAVLTDARVLADGSGLVFPSPVRPGRPLSDMALTKVLRMTGLAERATVHGFRTTFRTWASEQTNADHAVMELSLAHAVGSAVEQAYARSDLLDKRRRLLDRWGRFLTGVDAKVVTLHG